jgi:hypothetical protein
LGVVVVVVVVVVVEMVEMVVEMVVVKGVGRGLSVLKGKRMTERSLKEKEKMVVLKEVWLAVLAVVVLVVLKDWKGE